MNTSPALYYDAECKLCNTWLNMLSKIDKNNRIQYVALQSKIGNILSEKYNFDFEKANTVVFENNNKIYIRSEAVIECLSYLGGFWELLKVLQIFPLRIRDAVYNAIARNRYKWFGKTERCKVG